MSKIDQALATLSEVLKELEQKEPVVDYRYIVNNIPKQPISADLIEGGAIRAFNSTGITDTATVKQLTVSDAGVSTTNLSVANIISNVTVEKSLTVNGTVKAQRLEVSELQADVRVERSSSLEFKAGKGDTVYAKGLLWFTPTNTKQFILASDPDNFFSTETINLSADKTFSIGGQAVVSKDSLGSGVQKSNLRELGRLRSLAVDGDVNINNNIYYSASARRIGMGTDTPHSAISIVDNNVELVLGGTPESHGAIGTFTHSDLDLVTDNVSRINLASNGNITLGNVTRAPVQVNVHGKLAVGVNTPDPTVDLHVSGAIKFNNNIHTSGETAPSYGAFTIGDIVWNSKPTAGAWVGWICVGSGVPGAWLPFGAIAK